MTRPLPLLRAAAVLALFANAAYAQSPPPLPAPRASSAPGTAPPAQAPLTPAQLAQIKIILAPYKPAALTADDAKLIKRTLRDAGMRHSPQLDAALLAAGFSPQKLEQLDPRPQRPPP